jgi:hypothetical protein
MVKDKNICDGTGENGLFTYALLALILPACASVVAICCSPVISSICGGGESPLTHSIRQLYAVMLVLVGLFAFGLYTILADTCQQQMDIGELYIWAEVSLAYFPFLFIFELLNLQHMQAMDKWLKDMQAPASENAAASLAGNEVIIEPVV